MNEFGRIVIVDDEAMVTKTLVTLLKLEGFNCVTSFNNPNEALKYLNKNEADLIISDFIMPELNGIEFLELAKKMQKEVTTILLTGYADKENAIRAINEIGIFKYIEKPWDNDNLIINVRNALEQSRLKKELNNKIIELKEANKKLENYSQNLENLVQKRTLELSISNSKLNALFTGCADGIVTFDSDLKITDLNNSAIRLFGQSKKELTGANLFELVVCENKQFFKANLDFSKNLFLRNYSLINYEKDVNIPVEISIAPIQDTSGNFFVAVIRDVTYQKENERLRDDFMATLTHDLKTPLLATIQGTEFLLEEASNGINTEQLKLFLTKMQGSSEHMLGLVNALLQVYRYEAGINHLCKTKFDIVKLTKECVDELMPLAQKSNMKLSLYKNEDEIFINADRNELRRVVTNLIGNAIQHSQNGTEAKIEIVKDEKDLIFSVEDDGVGLEKEDCDKLFNRFSQGTKQKRSASTGLGLYLSRQIIEAHAGKIYVNSIPNEGSRFTFELKNTINDCKVIL